MVVVEVRQGTLGRGWSWLRSDSANTVDRESQLSRRTRRTTRGGGGGGERRKEEAAGGGGGPGNLDKNLTTLTWQGGEKQQVIVIINRK